MGRLIDLDDYRNCYIGMDGEYEKWNIDPNVIAEAQPEIIRCKDCKYGDRGIDEDGNPFLKCLGWVYGGTQEEDFCSHAERRTDGVQNE